MLPTPSTDSRSPAPTSQLDLLPQRLHPLLPQPSTQNLSLPQSLTELPQSQFKTPQRSLRPRPLTSPLLPPPETERDVTLTRRLLQQLLLFLLVSHTLVFPWPTLLLPFQLPLLLPMLPLSSLLLRSPLRSPPRSLLTQSSPTPLLSLLLSMARDPLMKKLLLQLPLLFLLVSHTLDFP